VTKLSPTSLDAALDALPRDYPGPGGAVAVMRGGEVLERRVWGWANAELRIPFTPRTLFRMCSITKQFTCGLVLDAFPDPTVLDADVAARLPQLQQPAPGALHLCHNQSGLRDYWAVAMLHGAPAESPFGDAEAGRVIAGTRSLHFAPGTRFSYVNQNFRIQSSCRSAPVAASPSYYAPASSTAPAWGARSSPPTPAPCRMGPRAMRARSRAASGLRKIASSGPATPAWAPASTT